MWFSYILKIPFESRVFFVNNRNLLTVQSLNDKMNCIKFSDYKQKGPNTIWIYKKQHLYLLNF